MIEMTCRYGENKKISIYREWTLDYAKKITANLNANAERQGIKKTYSCVEFF